MLCSSFSAKSRAPTTCSLACALTTTLVATGFLRLGRLRRPLEDSGVLHLFYQHRTKIPENLGFRGFFVAKSYFAGWLKISDPHRDPHAEMKQRNQWTQEWRTGKWASCPAHFSFCRYRTCSMKLPQSGTGLQVDSKLRQKIKEKKIAMGHKADDHEDPELTQSGMGGMTGY